MTLTELKGTFPHVYKLYKGSFYSRKMDLSPIDRIIAFIESNYNIVLINIVQEGIKKYRPCIRINGIDKKYNCLLPRDQSRLFLVSKAFEYLNTGVVS